MNLQPQIVIYDTVEFEEDTKEPCSICLKPVSLLYLVGIGNQPGYMKMCQSHMKATAKVQARMARAAQEAEPLFNGSNRMS